MKRYYLLLLATTISLASCGSYQYKSYDIEVSPGKTSILDLSNIGADTSTIYFGSAPSSAVGVSFHRLLLATAMDGAALPNSGRTGLLNVSGYQAIKVDSGVHSFDFCWVSMNALGTGGHMCNFSINTLSLEANKKYFVHWNTKGNIEGSVYGRQAHSIKVNTWVVDYDTGELVYPK